MKPNLLITLSVLFSICSINAFAQTQTLKIKLTERNSASIIGANIVLKERADTTKRQYGVTDTAGVAEFKFNKETQFLMTATFVGFRLLSRGIAVSNKQTSFTCEREGKICLMCKKELISNINVQL